MLTVKDSPCSSCPYRTDVPSGIWDPSEYEKLPPYDEWTGDQPLAPFMCHVSRDQACSGWATCHDRRPGKELLALRLAGSPEIPSHRLAIFKSGADASRHGLGGVKDPGADARAAMRRIELLRESA